LLILIGTEYSKSAVGWDSKGNFSILFNEMALSNWAKGGENQIAMTGLFGYAKNYHSEGDNMVWENALNLGYGFQTSDQYSYRKSEDKIDLTSKLGYRAVGKYYYSFAFSFQTQFDNGYKFPNDSDIVSKFMAPAYVIAAAGFDYKPYDKLSFSFYPLSGRLIVVNDQGLANVGAYGVKKAVIQNGVIITQGETSRFDFGASAKIAYSFTPMENIDIATKLDLFNNYTDPNEANRTNIDVNSETSVNMKINSYISANIFLHMIYDQDIPIPLYKKINGVKTQTGTGARLQTKQTLGIGFSYNFK
jgi:hypothetical protein